jgi:hypothetical protein
MPVESKMNGRNAKKMAEKLEPRSEFRRIRSTEDPSWLRRLITATMPENPAIPIPTSIAEDNTDSQYNFGPPY